MEAVIHSCDSDRTEGSPKPFNLIFFQGFSSLPSSLLGLTLFPTINQLPCPTTTTTTISWLDIYGFCSVRRLDWLLLIHSTALNVNSTSFQFCHLEKKKKSLITVVGEQVAFLRCTTTIGNTGWYAGWNVTSHSWSSRSPVSRFWKTHLHWPVTTIKRSAARTWHVPVHTRNSVKVAWFVCLAEKLVQKRSMKCVCLLMKGQANCMKCGQ